MSFIIQILFVLHLEILTPIHPFDHIILLDEQINILLLIFRYIMADFLHNGCCF